MSTGFTKFDYLHEVKKEMDSDEYNNRAKVADAMEEIAKFFGYKLSQSERNKLWSAIEYAEKDPLAP